MSVQVPNTQATLALDGVVEKVIFQSEDQEFSVAVIRCEESGKSIRIAGAFSDVEPGETVSVTGTMVTDSRFGPQVKVTALAPRLPHSEEGIRRFLASGRVEGIGPKLADRLVKHFGSETIKIISDTPERLKEVPGIGSKRRKEITSRIRNGIWHREAMIFLHGLGLGAAEALKIWKRYEQNTVHRIRNNPYRLIAELGGFGFKKTDRIALNLGIQPDSDTRIEAAVLYAIKSSMDEGHVCIPRDRLKQRVNRLVNSDIDCEVLIDTLISEKRLVENDGSVFLSFAYHLELKLAEYFATSSRLVYTYEGGHELPNTLSSEQKCAVELVMRHHISLLTGGPGTGKTTTLKAILAAITACGESVALAAPTGRAAKRMTESTGHMASTLHRLLGYHPQDGFRLNSENPLTVNWVIVDEASMIDISLMHGLLDALATETRLVLVGDADQLPSVGPGQILKDLINSQMIPVAHLKTIFRQATDSRIVEAAGSVREGRMPTPPQDGSTSDYYWIETNDAEQTSRLIETMVSIRIPSRFGFSAEREIQLLTPMHRGKCGTEVLNRQLQGLINPHGQPLNQRQQFRIGDKVMQVVNDHEREVYNGDMGELKFYGSDGVIVDFDGHVVTYKHDELEQLTLAYAVSIHKSQGSEYPVVIIPVLTEHWVMLNRNLLYTAITRGKSLVILIGQRKALRRAVENIEGLQRFTQLSERIVEMST